MIKTLLKTKLYIPPARSDFVPRPRLINQLNAGVNGRLSLVSAPAGYGKSTLLSEWARQTGHPVAWISLDKEDNTPSRFWAYVLAALQTIPGCSGTRIGESLMELVQSPQTQSINSFLTSLITEIIDFSEHIILILDDLHLINDPGIHNGLTFLLEHMPTAPSGMHLVISSRMDPPWPLARLRVRGEISEVRAKDLRFTPEEATLLLNKVMGLALPAHDIAELDQRTEGWIAGLQMAALSMQGRKNITAFLGGFTGSHRFILDYLMEEVLNQQEPEILDFLLKTSILEHLTGGLCDALTGGDQSQDILVQLEKANMFLVPLDDERRWYRYHHLFADLLQRHLEQTWPDQIATLHSKASAWYEENHRIAEAISHALAADEMARVARLVEANAFTMLDLSGMETMLRWLEEIPREVRLSRPWLGVAHAWVLVYAGHLRAVEKVLLQAEDALATLEGIEQHRVAGHISTIRAYAAWMHGEGERAQAFARQALAQLPEDDLTVRTLAATTLGAALIQCDDLISAAHARHDALDLGRASGNTHVYMLAASGTAYLLMLLGQLHEAEAVCREALAFAHDHADRPGGQSPAVAQIYAMLSAVMLRWNELDQAVALAREGVELSKHWGQTDTLTVNYVYLATALTNAGYLEEASAAVEQANRFGSHVSSWFEAIVGHVEAELNLRVGNLAAAARRIEEMGMDYRDALPPSRRSAYLALARILVAQGKLHEASHLLNRLIERVEANGATGEQVSALPLQALVMARQGEEGKALAMLNRALKLAEPERIMLPFLAIGEAMIPILEDAAALGDAQKFAGEILAALEVRRGAAEPLQDRIRDIRKPVHLETQQRLAEPLSERELHVLRWLDSHLSIKEIAQELYVAPSTIRTHVRNIYRKLDVHGRLEAIQKAKETGLI